MKTWRFLRTHSISIILCFAFFAIILAVVDTQKISEVGPQDRLPVSDFQSEHIPSEPSPRGAREETTSDADNRQIETKIAPPASAAPRQPDISGTASAFGGEASEVLSAVPTPVEKRATDGATADRATGGEVPDAGVPSGAAAADPAVVSDPLLESFQATDFYRTILEHNLFAPLGTSMAREMSPDYRLMATLIPRDAAGDRSPEAVILTTATQTTQRVRVGDALETGTTLVDIQPKYIILEKDGDRRTLRLDTSTLWLE